VAKASGNTGHLAATAEKRRIRPVREEPAPAPALYAGLLNTAKAFRSVYHMRPGGPRRQALLALFRQYPEGQLPVNNHYQANTIDPDLAQLLKRGLLRQERGGGGRRHPMSKSSSKRQTYLVLA
jgi:hypothetical protein